MRQNLQILLLPREAADELTIRETIAKLTGHALTALTGYTILKRSIDARGKQARVALSVEAFINEPYQERPSLEIHFPDVTHSRKEATFKRLTMVFSRVGDFRFTITFRLK